MDLEKELQSPLNSHPTFSGREIFASEFSPFNPISQTIDSPLTFCKSFSEISSCSSTEIPDKKMLLPKNVFTSSVSKETNEETFCNPMNTSVDSAIGLHSAPGSRSGSSSPISQHLSQSMMRYEAFRGVCASIKHSPVGDGINPIKTEELCKQHLVQLEDLIKRSNLDPKILPNTVLSNLLTYSTMQLPSNIKTGLKETEKKIPDTPSSRFRERCDSYNCNPCGYCQNLLLRLNLLRAQHEFLFSETPTNCYLPESVKNVQMHRSSQTNNHDCPDETYCNTMKTKSSHRDSAIEVNMTSSTDTLYYKEL